MDTDGSAQSVFVQTELRCIEAVILAKIMETANADPKVLLREIARLQKKPASHYERRCTEGFACWVHGIQHLIQLPALERKIRQVLVESKELVSEIEKLQPCGTGVFHSGYVSVYKTPHSSYFNTRARDNKCLAALRSACLAIIAETIHRRCGDSDVFCEVEPQKCESPLRHLGDVTYRLSEYMSKFAESGDSTHLIQDLVQIELEYYRTKARHE